jgi:hypothetical protein
MGYYTRYELEILEGEDYDIDYECEIGKESGYGNPFDDECKWYEHEEHMRAFSKLHPNTIFKVSGKGEEAGDIWNEYYQNGLMQRCKAQIMLAKFDRDKMK